MARFIECKDACGENCLIDPMSVIAVEQYKENGEEITVVYFYDFHMELSEPYESVKEKLMKNNNFS